jgi:hypothetical protein
VQGFLNLPEIQGLKPPGCPRFAARLKPSPDTELPTSEFRIMGKLLISEEENGVMPERGWTVTTDGT